MLACTCVCFVAHLALLYWWPDLKERLGSPMDSVLVWVVYTVVPATTFAIVLFLVNLVMSPVRNNREKEDLIESLRPAGDLALYMNAMASICGSHGVYLPEVTLTNRSDQNMSLEFSLSVDGVCDIGSPRRYHSEGEWNGKEHEPMTGLAVVDVPAKTTLVGCLAFHLMDDASKELRDAALKNKPFENATMHIHELVTDTRVLGFPFRYPPQEELISMEDRKAHE